MFRIFAIAGLTCFAGGSVDEQATLLQAHGHLMWRESNEKCVEKAVQMKEAGKKGDELKEFKEAGCLAEDMAPGGFGRIADLKAAGFTAKDCVGTRGSEAFKPDRIPEALAAGYTLGDLKDAGYTAQRVAEDMSLKTRASETMKRSGFTAAEAVAGFTAADKKYSWMDRPVVRAYDLWWGGYTGFEMKAAGFKAEDLQEAVAIRMQEVEDSWSKRDEGWSRQRCPKFDLKDIFRQEELGGRNKKIDPCTKGGGCTVGCRLSNFNLFDGCTWGHCEEIRDLKEAGCTAQQTISAGYSLEALKTAGYTAEDLGFD